LDTSDVGVLLHGVTEKALDFNDLAWFRQRKSDAWIIFNCCTHVITFYAYCVIFYSSNLLGMWCKYELLPWNSRTYIAVVSQCTTCCNIKNGPKQWICIPYDCLS
jgi:hypothetical protein